MDITLVVWVAVVNRILAYKLPMFFITTAYLVDGVVVIRRFLEGRLLVDKALSRLIDH